MREMAGSHRGRELLLPLFHMFFWHEKFFSEVLDRNTNRYVNNVREVSDCGIANEPMCSNTEVVKIEVRVHTKFLYPVLQFLWFKSVHHWDITIWATDVSMWDFAFPRARSEGLRRVVKVNSSHYPLCRVSHKENVHLSPGIWRHFRILEFR